MANIVIKPASGTLEFNTGAAAGSAVDATLSGASRFTFNNGELNLVSYATGNLNRFTVDGSTSRLFTAYDQMSGSLMSVNTIAGFPVFEVFSDNTVVLGKYGSKDFVSTGNRIGIGTASPSNKLEVFGTGDVSVRITTTGNAAATDFAALRFFQGGTQRASMIANSGVLRIGAGDGIGATSGVYVSSAGSVGIGTATPNYNLEILGAGTEASPTTLSITSPNSTTAGDSRIVLSQNTSLGDFQLLHAGTDSRTDSRTSNNAYIEQNQAINIRTKNNGTAFNSEVLVGGGIFFSTNATNSLATERMRIDTSGNVGIGTSTPASKLSLATHTAASGGITFGTDTNLYRSSAGALKTDGALVVVNSVFIPNNAGVANSSTANNAFLRMNTGGALITRDVGSSDANPALIVQQVNAGSLGDILQLKNNASTLFTVQQAGNVGIGTTTPSGKLEVFGTGDVSVRITTSGNAAATDFAALRFFQGGTQKALVVANNDLLRLSAGTNLSGIFISDSGNVGIHSIPTGANSVRFQVNGSQAAEGIAALRFENCGTALAGTLGLGGKTFYGWLPIQIDSSTTKHIPLYT